jgi:hypothetical protein
VTIWSRSVFWLGNDHIVRPMLLGYLRRNGCRLVDLWRRLNKVYPKLDWVPIIRNGVQKTDCGIVKSVTIWSRFDVWHGHAPILYPVLWVPYSSSNWHSRLPMRIRSSQRA